jgi:ATP/maltotriose-dependent transcriptional regulator MalT
LGRQVADMQTIVWACLGLGHAALAGGQASEAEEWFRQGLQFGRETGDPRMVYVPLWSLGEAKRAKGDLESAEDLLSEALGQVRAQGDHAGIGYTLSSLGHVALLLGDYPRAVSLQLESLASRRLADAVYIPICLDELAMVAAAAGELTRAARIFAAADTLRVQGGGVPWPLTFGDREAAFATIGAGLGDRELEAATAAGHQLSIEQVLAEVSRLPRRTSAPLTRQLGVDPRAREVPGQLSGREWEVAGLIARGLSNRQIADVLIVGERTAANHVEHIFQKLGFHSRAQVAAWAIEQRVTPGLRTR